MRLSQIARQPRDGFAVAPFAKGECTVGTALSHVRLQWRNEALAATDG